MRLTPGRTIAGIAAALSMAAAGFGCSWATVRRPAPPMDATTPVECTASRAAPVTDTVLATLAGLGGVGMVFVGATMGCSDPNNSVMCLNSGDQTAVIAGGVAMLAGTLALAASAASGYRSTATCRDALAAQHGCRSGDAEACAAVARLFERPRPAPVTAVPASQPGLSCTSDVDCIPRGGRRVARACRP